MIELEDVLRLRLEPGDAVVLRAAEPMSAAAVETLRRRWLEAFPEHRCIVLDAGMSIDVLTPESETPRPEGRGVSES